MLALFINVVLPIVAAVATDLYLSWQDGTQ